MVPLLWLILPISAPVDNRPVAGGGWLADCEVVSL
jgi:hypothetical protein